MKQQSKFSTKQEQVAQQQAGQQVEFASSEELLRYDAAQTVLPPDIAQRLQKSLAGIAPPAPKPWWKAWLRR
jgi:hypothetical protein